MEDTLESLFADNVEEDIERLRRRKERVARMQREKREQMRRRRQMKLLFIKVILAIIPIMIIVVVISVIKKGNEQQEAVSIQIENLDTDVSEGIDMPLMENMDVELPMLAVDSKESYSFVPTSSTSTIYNEEVISSHAILIDESANTIVASKSAKERISPASMTKVLTILVAAENITEEQLKDTCTMTREITDYGYINDCSEVGFLEGEQIRVKDLFYGTILPSGSDAAVGLAVYVAGSHEAFVEMLNEKLKELGLEESSHYTNCVGVYDEKHYSTVYDMAIIMKAAIQNEFCKEVLSRHNYITESTEQHPEGINISNWFLRRIEDKDTGGEVLCAKTGYVSQSKNCAVSYGEFANGKPYICVTAGSSSSWRCIYDHVEIYNEYIRSS